MAYVYRHIRVDKNEPFYIGIGKTKYRATTSQNRNNIWLKIVSKTKYEVEILLDDITWEDATKKEIEFIKIYGRINNGTGILANMTDGGDGNLGLVHSAEALIKISESSKNRVGYWNGKKMSDQAKSKMSESKKGVSNVHLIGRKVEESTKEAVKRHSIGNSYHLGISHTEDTKRKISQSKIEKGYGKPVIQYDANGIFVQEFTSSASAARHFGVSANSIIGAIREKGATKQRLCKGYIWKYK